VFISTLGEHFGVSSPVAEDRVLSLSTGKVCEVSSGHHTLLLSSCPIALYDLGVCPSSSKGKSLSGL
jgi:hypothetical protein